MGRDLATTPPRSEHRSTIQGRSARGGKRFRRNGDASTAPIGRSTPFISTLVQLARCNSTHDPRTAAFQAPDLAGWRFGHDGAYPHPTRHDECSGIGVPEARLAPGCRRGGGRTRRLDESRTRQRAPAGCVGRGRDRCRVLPGCRREPDQSAGDSTSRAGPPAVRPPTCGACGGGVAVRGLDRRGPIGTGRGLRQRAGRGAGPRRRARGGCCGGDQSRGGDPERRPPSTRPAASDADTPRRDRIANRRGLELGTQRSADHGSSCTERVVPRWR